MCVALTAEMDGISGRSLAPDTSHLSVTTSSASRLPSVNPDTGGQPLKTLAEVINISEQLQDAGSEQ